MLSVSCVFIFLCLYNSDNKKERNIAIAALALAAGIKVYPALFAIFYFKKRQIKELVSCAILSILFAFLPFLFFKGGFSNIPLMLQSSAEYSASVLGKVPLSTTSIYDQGARLFPNSSLFSLSLEQVKFITILICFVSVVLALFEKCDWRKLTLTTMATLYVFNVAYTWQAIVMFASITLFFATIKTRKTAYNIFVFIIFIIILNPYLINIKDLLDKHNIHADAFLLNYPLVNVAMLLLWLSVIIGSAANVLRCIRARELTIWERRS
ncbi:MAG: hypothetical protein Ta2B_19110 [Termitinemataceae bacterium]|nr:MAG: hypothetical protein Ta2B_19110 [Termitinemataceae bacterium]